MVDKYKELPKLFEDKKYLYNLADKLIEEQNKNGDKVERISKLFFELTQSIKRREEVSKYLEKIEPYLPKENYHLFITSRGEIPPIIALIHEHNKNYFIFPNIVSVQNIGKNNYHNYPEVIFEKFASRMARAKEVEKLISIDELTTGMSLAYRVELLNYLAILENKLKKEGINIELLPEHTCFLNLASNFYYGETIDSNKLKYYKSIRSKNMEKIEELKENIRELTGKNVEVSLIPVEDPVPWQDNNAFYEGILTSYLPFPKTTNNLYHSIRGKLGEEKAKEFFNELSKVHKELTKEFLQKVGNGYFVGFNGLYIIDDEKFNNYPGGYDGFIKDYTNESIERTYQLMKQYGVGKIEAFKLDEENGPAIWKIKKSPKITKLHKKIAEWSDLRRKSLKNTEDDKLIGSGLRLLLSFRKNGQ